MTNPAGQQPESAPTVVFDQLSKTFSGRVGLARRAWLKRAVRDVSFTIDRSESLALVGESGSGKSTLARMLVGLEIPTSGRMLLQGRELSYRPKRAEREERARVVQMVFQDPYTSLTPNQSVRAALEEMQSVYSQGCARQTRRDRVEQLLDAVGLGDREGDARPRNLSGGQRQRAAIARALAADPVVLVLDEAVSALDVSIQAQILNLLADLRRDLGLAYLFISHDLSVVRQVAERVVVLYRGRVVEYGPVTSILKEPGHPYAQRLLRSVPRPGVELKRRQAVAVEGDTGCVFMERCSYAYEACAEEPGLFEVQPGHGVRCWLASARTT